jgi:hypothetical protein
MRKILFVSIAFPPKSDPESLQVGRYLKYISKQEYQIEAITSSNPTLYMETDDQLVSMSKKVYRIKEVKIIENKYVNYIISRLFPWILEFPDSKFSFHLNEPKLEMTDLIYSRSYPLSSTLLALKIKKKWPSIPWILHLSDPWTTTFIGDSPATNFNRLSKKWNEKKEAECFNLADKISFTSDKTIQLYRTKYPELLDKFILTPNVFDDEFVNESRVDFSRKLNIVYTGGFGEKRDPIFYLNSIKSFLEAQSGFNRNLIQFIFTGPMTQKNKRKFDKFSTTCEIKHHGHLDYYTMIQIQMEAHILVNIDTDIEDAKHSVFFPSKLLEYFAANRRILAITNNHSVTFETIKGKFGDCVQFGETEKLKNLFRLYLEKFKKNNSVFFELDSNIKKFSASVNAKKLEIQMNKLIT